MLKISPYSFQYVSDKLKEDKAVIKQALTLEGRNLQFLPENLRDDTNLASMAVKQNVDAFKYVSKRLRANRDFVLDSVHQANPNTIDSVAIYANKETLTDTKIASIIAETNKSKLAKILKNNHLLLDLLFVPFCFGQKWNLLKIYQYYSYLIYL